MKMKQKFPIGSSAISAATGVVVCSFIGLTLPVSASIVVVTGGAGWLFGRKVAYEKGKSADFCFEAGEKCYNSKNYLGAQAWYENSIKQNPEHVEALYKLGWLFQYGEGVKIDLNIASEYYQKAIQEGHYESKKQLLIIENPELKTADQWSDLGEEYYYGQNGKGRDYSCARACYEKAVSLYSEHSFLSRLFSDDSKYARTLYLLGWLYQYGQGVNTDLIKAAEYYEQSAQKNHYESKKQLLIISNPEIKTSNQWFSLGQNYYYSKNGKSQDYHHARVCFERAIELNSKHASAFYYLGWLFHYANRTDKKFPTDFAKAKEYYEKAIREGQQAPKFLIKRATKELLIIDNPMLTTADQWLNLGEDYYYGRNGKKCDRSYARACYVQANTLAPKNRYALFSLGWLYHHGGHGITKDLQLAKDYYKKGVEIGDENASKQLPIVEGAAFTTPQQWHTLGELYSQKKTDKYYTCAKICYEKALEFGFHADSAYSLAKMFHYGLGMEVDKKIAIILYHRAAINGHIDAKVQLELEQLKERSKQTAATYYWFINQFSWAISLGISLFETSHLTEEIGNAFFIPVMDRIADATDLQWVPTVARGAVETSSFLVSPVGYLVRKGTSKVLHGAIDRLELTNPIAETALRLTADFASTYAARRTVEQWEALLEAYNKESEENKDSKTDQAKDESEEKKDSETDQPEGEFKEEKDSENDSKEEIENSNPASNPASFFNSKDSQTDQEVYFFERPLDNPLFKLMGLVDNRANHAGFIVKDLKTGTLTLFELSIDGKFVKKNQISGSEVAKFSTKHSKSLCRVGKTKLSTDEIRQKAEQWAKENPGYEKTGKNCRSFTDSMLRDIILGNGELADTLRTKNFRASPTEACERRLRRHKDEEPKVIRSPSP